MQGCLAPSEVPGVTTSEASVFGGVAEDIIFADFASRYATLATDVFQDSNNPAAYLFFLASKNPQFTQALQTDYFERVKTEKLMRVPDFLVHSAAERAFYEVKPDSASGLTAGMQKVGALQAVYAFYGLPYRGGTTYTPRDHTVANFGTTLRVTLKVRRTAPGLIVYKLCLDSDGAIELATLAVLLRYIVQQINAQKGSGSFRPVDLEPAFARNQPLEALARTLGIVVAAGTAAIGWKYFWRAVVARFALRGAAAATLAVADGPLPVGDLLALGLTLWTVVDVIRLSDELWRDAARIKTRGA